MMLHEVAHKKKHVAQRDNHPLCKDVERIFKWTAALTRLSGEYQLGVLVPPFEDEEALQFSLRMFEKKLPSLVQKHLGEEWSVLRPRYIAPMTKAVAGHGNVTHKMGSRGLTIKVRLV